jgi:predicted nucleic acid-binding protein
VSSLVLDTDGASAVLKERLPDSLATRLAGEPLAITFVTVGELTQWTFRRRWGPQRRAGLDRFFARVVALLNGPRVARIWGEIQAPAQMRGRPRPVNDSWVAACCLARELPLATLDIEDYTDFAEHEGLDLIR